MATISKANYTFTFEGESLHLLASNAGRRYRTDYQPTVPVSFSHFDRSSLRVTLEHRKWVPLVVAQDNPERGLYATPIRYCLLPKTTIQFDIRFGAIDRALREMCLKGETSMTRDGVMVQYFDKCPGQAPELPEPTFDNGETMSERQKRPIGEGYTIFNIKPGEMWQSTNVKKPGDPTCTLWLRLHDSEDSPLGTTVWFNHNSFPNLLDELGAAEAGSVMRDNVEYRFFSNLFFLFSH